MALTTSNEAQLGKKAIPFSLPNVVTGEMNNLDALKGTQGTVVLFICNHCPFVIHVNEILIALANHNYNKGIRFIAISSNDIEKYPQDAPDKMKEVALKENYPFPYLFDETQEIAKAYDATCTPDIFLYDQNLKEVYHGRLDASSPGNDIPVSGNELQAAIDILIAGGPSLENQLPSMGCGIKWKL
ncbi:thioredoxin family protein [uncultured Polaribacter sp.]|uniref:thioredoxin family protein n=1 Tax=uncultured Polaribacter sp. TaxID=174711 RepID=UPI002612AD74|nr:thioredoxin family protein [uncultured Polaribacter sp.]